MSELAGMVRDRLVVLARARERDKLRAFALGCASSVAAGSPPPLWSEALDLLSRRLAGTIDEGSFRRSAAALQCRFPMLTVVSGLRAGDPRAAATLAVMAALHASAYEAAVDAAIAERMHAQMAGRAAPVGSESSDDTKEPQETGEECAVRRCVQVQLGRLITTS
jgi:hypothetical protein